MRGMEYYDYEAGTQEIVNNYIKEEYIPRMDIDDFKEQYTNPSTDFLDLVREGITEQLDSALGASDQHTKKEIANEHLAGNLGTLVAACDDYGIDLGAAVRRGPVFCDAIIHESLLPNAIENARNGLANEFDKAFAKLIKEDISFDINNNMSLSAAEKNASLSVLDEKTKGEPGDVISNYLYGDLSLEDCVAEGIAYLPDKEPSQPEKDEVRS